MTNAADVPCSISPRADNLNPDTKNIVFGGGVFRGEGDLHESLMMPRTSAGPELEVVYVKLAGLQE